MDDHHADSNCEPPSVERLIAETQWAELTTRLLGYTQSHVKRYRSFDPSIGDRASDYVQEAIARFLDGTRIYDGKKPLFNWFCSQIDSLTSHDREKANRRGREVAIDQPAGQAASESPSANDWLASGEDLEQAIIARDELEHFLSTLDPDLRRYVLLRIHGAMTAEECAAAMGTTVERIRNFDRRLRRRRRAA